MKDDSKRQTMLLVGFAMIVISAIMVYVSLSSPRVYDEKTERVGVETGSSHSEQTPVQTVPNSSMSQSAVSYPINLNTATAEALMQIDGIGEKRAADIIAYREAIGGYKSVGEIRNIKGIGDTLYNQISPYLTV